MVPPVGQTTYTYDLDNRLTNLTDPFRYATTWTYDRAGRVVNESTVPNAGVPISTSYIWGGSNYPGDPSTAPDYLSLVSQSINSVAYWQYSVQHSYLGQILGQAGSYLAGQSSSEAYTYDARGRLASDSDSTSLSGGFSTSGSYAYDLANNITPPGSSWAYNTNNQATAAPATTGLAGATGLAYDFSGNMTTANGATATYDPFGQLVAMSGTTTASITYDSAGRRVSKTAGGMMRTMMLVVW